MKYLSVCSGIEAATVAWHPLGWEPVAFSENDKFPSAVLSHHYPDVPNLGDMTNHDQWNLPELDVLVGGTPCQSFSVAGLRKGMADPRGNLSLTFLAILDQFRPRWMVWENVPGVLSLHGGRDFGSFLGALGELGYGFAYRTLDAQYAGVPQRRRRVFVVGHSGGAWQPPAAILFESESMRGDSPPSRKARKETARGATQCFGGNRTSGPIDVAPACNAHAGPHGRLDFESEAFVTHSLRGEGFDASEDGTGLGTPLVPYTLAIRKRDGVCDLEYRQDGTANAVVTPNGGRGGMNVGAIAFAQNQREEVRELDVAGRLPAIRRGDAKNETLLAFHNRQDPDVTGDITHPLGAKDNGLAGQQAMLVRRLTPLECERLQGFPDNYTRIQWRGKPPSHCPDGPRYKAIGNSMAVPVMRWIGERLSAIEHLN